MSGQPNWRWTGELGNGIVSGDVSDGAWTFHLSPKPCWQASVSCSENRRDSQETWILELAFLPSSVKMDKLPQWEDERLGDSAPDL